MTIIMLINFWILIYLINNLWENHVVKKHPGKQMVNGISILLQAYDLSKFFFYYYIINFNIFTSYTNPWNINKSHIVDSLFYTGT